MKRRLLIIDAAQRSYRLETLRVETLAHDERQDYLTLHGEALCQYVIQRVLPSSDQAASQVGGLADGPMVIARGPFAFLAGNKATVGYLSPLTGVPHYSFVGGRAAAQLFALGLDAIVVQGQAEGQQYIVVAGRAPSLDVSFGSADDLPGGQRAAYYFLVQEELEGDAEAGSVFTLGQGGRYGYQIANLAVDAIYHAGRGGAGAVFGRFARAMVLHGEPLEQASFFSTIQADPAFTRSPNRAIARRLNEYTARLSGLTGGTIVKLPDTGGQQPGQNTLPARNALQMGYELADLGGDQVLAATRDGHTGCHWCPVDCRHWHWVEVDYAPEGRDRFLDDFEPTYAIFAMLGLVPAENTLAAKIALLKEVNRTVIVPIEQMGCDIVDIGVGLAALFEGLEQGLIPQSDVPSGLQSARLGDLQAAQTAVALLREGVDGGRYPALRAVGDGPQALGQHYPGMQDIVFTCGEGTLGNAGHSNTLWTFLMPFSRFFSHYSGQTYKIDEVLPQNPNDHVLRALFQRVIARTFDREFFGILCNALSCCAFTFVIFSQDGAGETLDEQDLLVQILGRYGIHTTRQDLMWFAQAFWAQSIALKAQFGWRPPTARDLPLRIYESLEQVLGQPVEELTHWMDLLIREWVARAANTLSKFGYDTSWLSAQE